jgi:hypothetical protein
VEKPKQTTENQNAIMMTGAGASTSAISEERGGSAERDDELAVS